jgi:hypothetical protein
MRDTLEMKGTRLLRIVSLARIEKIQLNINYTTFSQHRVTLRKLAQAGNASGGTGFEILPGHRLS